MDAMNQLKIDRALAAMSPGFRYLYNLLPVLFHYHQPGMPGFQQTDVPFGISRFVPDSDQWHALQTLLPAGQVLQSQLQVEAPIIGLYSMGSTSSVGQSSTSDLDIWVCHHAWLDNHERQALENKCLILQNWCHSYGLEISFFLIDENRFRRHESGPLGNEDCGSMQHNLLLDEFYRSAVRLAGRRILWNMVPVEKEHCYDEYVNSLYAQSIFTPNDWLDLGGLSTLSAEEYFGASLWQLYKSIDSPYKAVLKTLLLEAYSWEYPNTQLLALEIKQHLHNGEIISYGLDPYCMMLERVTRYLEAMGDSERLELVRHCFYLKVREKMASNNALQRTQWRREILSQLVKEWGWDANHLSTLANRAEWKIEKVRPAHDELLATMMQSYRNLIRFARSNNLQMSACPQDIGVLTRKLYAAFEALPGKVILFNPQISPDLSEPDLTFIYVAEGKSNRAGWYLYNQAPTKDAIISHQPLEYNRTLLKLVAWCWFNGLLTAQTRIHFKGHALCNGAKLSELVVDMMSNFSIHVPAPTPAALYSPCEIRQLAIIVNLEHDPTEILNNQTVHFDLRKLDVLSFGQQQLCLVGSIDLLYRNSWNEVRTLHFEGKNCMIEALKTILGKMHQGARTPDSVEILCYSQHLPGLIRTRVEQLVSECIELRLRSSQQDQGRFKALHLAGETWGLFFERLSISAQKLENAVEFYGAISNNKLHGLSIQMDKNQSPLPAVVNNYASEGIIQFFFEDNPEAADFSIYVLDENNKVEIYRHCEGSKDELVRDVSRFYSASHDRHTYETGSINFNLPQFYQLVNQKEMSNIVPFRGESQESLLEKPSAQLSLSQLFRAKIRPK
jgi:adenylate cyclase, class 1